MEKELSEKILAARKAALLNQAELAAIVGVSVGTVWAWEKGRTKPRMKHLRKLVETLGGGLTSA
jgi:transcriptional regulator with XRE-family HTH domain